MGEAIIIDGAQSMVMINDLQADTSYSFSLTAVDTSNNRSETLELMARTSDNQAPTWPASSTLNLEAISDTSALLSWPDAEDNGTLSTYEIFKDLSLIESIPSDQTGYDLSNLEPDQSYLLQIVAIDRVGQRSLPLELTVQTTDSEAPIWPNDLGLAITYTGETTAQIRWPEANDNVGVMGYRVDLDGVNVYTGNQQQYTELSHLEPNISYSIAVYAQDRFENWSQALTGIVQTIDETTPSWPLGAQLVGEALSESEIMIQWPSANDNIRVSAYLVYIDDQGGDSDRCRLT